MDQKVKIAFSIIAIARILQIFLDYNYDWPDEYWQGPEIAYKLANGYGFQTWEWTMQHPIRSILYPAYLSVGYFVGNLLKVQPIIKQKMVKLMQIFLAILCDWFLLKTALVYNNRLTLTTSILILSNWFYFSMMNRTYINSAETCLTVVAFYYWLIRDRSKKNDLISRLIVGLCFLIRTTSVIVWAVIWPFELFTMKSNRIKFIIKNIIQIFLMISVSILFNSFWYQRFTFVEYNFFKYNILLKWSQLYGVNSFFHYFYVVIPLILGAYILPMIISFVALVRNDQQRPLSSKKNDDGKKETGQQQHNNKRFKHLSFILLVILLILSLSAHKESRFLLIVTPFLMILCAKGIQKIEKNSLLIFAIISINLCFITVFGLYGKHGGVNILRQLRTDIENNKSYNLEDISIVYLCEPHSLPSYSIVQKNVTLRLLDTSPLRKLQGFNQQIQLKQNPLALYNRLTSGQKQSSIVYLIIQEKYSIFNGHLREEYQFLLQNNYQLIKSERNINLVEQHYGGYDGFVLFKKS